MNQLHSKFWKAALPAMVLALVVGAVMLGL
jgi:hypothetical protein